MPCAILIGPPGSGKSTIGRALAKSLDVRFIDSDSEVEKQSGKRISDIFIEDGEEVFRDLEFLALSSALKESSSVLSLGGGAPIPERAQELLAKSTVPIFFLDVSLSVAAPRVGFNRDRPLLLGNPRAQWQSLYEARRPIYEKLSTHTIKVDSMSINEIVQSIKSEIK